MKLRTITDKDESEIYFSKTDLLRAMASVPNTMTVQQFMKEILKGNKL